MALGAFAQSGDKAGGAASAPTFIKLISFDGDASYPTGGTEGFQALYRALTETQEEVLALIPEDCGGFTPVYDKSEDKLKVYRTGSSNAAMEEVPNNTDLSGTKFNVWVVTK